MWSEFSSKEKLMQNATEYFLLSIVAILLLVGEFMYKESIFFSSLLIVITIYFISKLLLAVSERNIEKPTKINLTNEINIVVMFGLFIADWVFYVGDHAMFVNVNIFVIIISVIFVGFSFYLESKNFRELTKNVRGFAGVLILTALGSFLASWLIERGFPNDSGMILGLLGDSLFGTEDKFIKIVELVATVSVVLLTILLIIYLRKDRDEERNQKYRLAIYTLLIISVITVVMYLLYIY